MKNKLSDYFITRRLIYAPTLLGCALLLSIVMMSSAILSNFVVPFLALNHPIKASVLVVEGWLPDYALQESLNEFKRGTYQYLLVTGTPTPPGYLYSSYKSFADLGAKMLTEMSSDQEIIDSIVAVPCSNVVKDRTYSSAVSVKDWLVAHSLLHEAINIVSLGVHSRRTWLLFVSATGKTSKSIGVLSIKDLEYDPKTWWSTSQGFRVILGEIVAYVYAKFIFPI